MKKTLKISALVLGGLILVITLGLWYNKKNQFTPVSTVRISLPHTFKTTEAENLSIAAFDLRKTEQYDEAINLYGKAIKIEPDNPRLFFDLSECYSRLNKLEQAILRLDTAIALDDSYAGFYNNRGLIYYKLDKDENAISDFKKAVQLDSSNWVFYANMALAYNSADNEEEACKALRASKLRGLNLNNEINQGDLEELLEVCE